jgi:hypothetical protein
MENEVPIRVIATRLKPSLLARFIDYPGSAFELFPLTTPRPALNSITVQPHMRLAVKEPCR